MADGGIMRVTSVLLLLQLWAARGQRPPSALSSLSLDTASSSSSSLPTYENILPSCSFPGACAGKGSERLCGGSTALNGTAWEPFQDAGARGALTVLLDTSSCGLATTTRCTTGARSTG